MLSKIVSSALLLAGLFASQQPQQQQQEKGANEAEGWATYAPVKTESFVIQNYLLSTTGIVIGTGAAEWTLMAGSGSAVTDNIVASDSLNPVMLMSNTNYTLPLYGEWQAMAGVSFASSLLSGSVASPYGANQDPFYGQGYFGALNYEKGWAFSFALTNTKVYAVYSRLPVAQTLLDNYFSFTYYVPIAQRSAVDVDTLAVVINKKENQVSWRANGFELLQINRPGQAIADKFRVGTYGGVVADIGLPDTMQLAIGVSVPFDNAQPHPVCQQTLFQACGETIDCAYKTLCQYATPQNTTTFSFGLSARFYFVNVVEQIPVLTCYEQHKCPDLSTECSCDDVKTCSSSWFSSCSSSSSSSSSCGCFSSSSSSSCGCPSSSSSSSSSCPPKPCSSSSSHHGCCVVAPETPETICEHCGSSSDCGHGTGFIKPPHQAASSSSDSCEPSSEDCRQRRNMLQRRGFIFPY